MNVLTLSLLIGGGWPPLVLLALGGLKLAAKRTESVWDDRIVTLLIFLVKASRGKIPGVFDGIRGKGTAVA